MAGIPDETYQRALALVSEFEDGPKSDQWLIEQLWALWQGATAEPSGSVDAGALVKEIMQHVDDATAKAVDGGIALSAKLSRLPVVLVPREPTPDMIEAGDYVGDAQVYTEQGGMPAFSVGGSKDVWLAMVAAAFQQGR